MPGVKTDLIQTVCKEDVAGTYPGPNPHISLGGTI